MYVEFNPNTCGKSTGDCVIRAISIVLEKTWEQAYIELTIQGLMDCDVLSNNEVWGNYLRRKGFKRYIIPDTCPNCYTVEDFCRDHPYGEYVLATGNHAIAAINGNWIDAWDSGRETVIYYFQR